MLTTGMAGVITPVYQPVVLLSSGTPLYFESLARATSKRNHLDLLNFAESYGFIAEIDIAMMDLAAQVLETTPDIRIGVNVSARTVERNCGDMVCAIYRHLPIAHRLVIEITETAPIVDHKLMRTFVSAVRATGAMIAFDDFGDGYFTFPLLHQYQPEILKLASCMLSNRREKARELMRIMQVAKEIGSTVVAEGVDSEEKRIACLDMGIEFAQGFLVGSVMPEPVVVTGNPVDYRMAVAGGGNRVMVLGGVPKD